MTGQLFRMLGSGRRAATRASRQLLASICLVLLAVTGTTGCAAATAPTAEAVVQFTLDAGGILSTVQQATDIVRSIYRRVTHVPAAPAGVTSIVIRQAQSDGAVADVLQLNVTGHLVFNVTGKVTMAFDGSTVTLTVPPTRQAVEVTKAGSDSTAPYQVVPVATLEPLTPATTDPPRATVATASPSAPPGGLFGGNPATTEPGGTDLFGSPGPTDTPAQTGGILFPQQSVPDPTTQDAPPTTYAETTGPAGSGAFTNYTNASGTGQRIAANQTVDVSCVVQGFAVEDGNTSWYRVSSSPWNDQYYASSDNFYDNGATSGSVNTGVPVDPAVPPC